MAFFLALAVPDGIRSWAGREALSLSTAFRNSKIDRFREALAQRPENGNSNLRQWPGAADLFRRNLIPAATITPFAPNRGIFRRSLAHSVSRFCKSSLYPSSTLPFGIALPRL